MAVSQKASLASQLGSAVCEIEDSEEQFWLREADDCQSKVALGNSLAAQYRFREAIDAYRQALRIRNDDWMTHLRLGGACLTLRLFDEAMEQYEQCLVLGAGERAVAFQMGVWHYLRGTYDTAAAWFEKVLPCGGELEIAVIYWHALCCFRLRQEPLLLSRFHADMEVGHHTAYKLAAAVFCGETAWEDALLQIRQEHDPLNFVIALYGICAYLSRIGETAELDGLQKELLACDTCWPCISYLAAWGDQLPAG